MGRHGALFADWCTAVDRVACPATADTVLAFLAELPAGPATTRRRIHAIDAVHHAAGYRPPSVAPAFDHLLRPERPPRFDPDQVAHALRIIPVGGWPVGITGRRDAALVALVCTAGLTRRQIQALHSAPDNSYAATVSALATEDPGRCPACALSRWLRVQAMVAAGGWRAVRDELADIGHTFAGSETVHDCARPVTWPPSTTERRSPLFTAIDRHGIPAPTHALSTRSITTIVATRLAAAEQDRSAPTELEEHHERPIGTWGEADQLRVWEQRKDGLERLAAIDSSMTLTPTPKPSWNASTLTSAEESGATTMIEQRTVGLDRTCGNAGNGGRTFPHLKL